MINQLVLRNFALVRTKLIVRIHMDEMNRIECDSNRYRIAMNHWRQANRWTLVTATTTERKTGIDYCGDWRTGGLAQQYLQRSWWHTEDKDTEIERKTIENKTRPQTEQQRHWQVASILSILMKTFSIDNSNEVSSISFFRYYLHSISINSKFQITINTNFLYLNHSIGNQRIYRNLLLLFRVSIKPNNIFVKI